jgi:hypothetical protein
MALPVTLAMVPLGPNARLSASKLVADLALKWPALPPAESLEESDGQLAFRIGSQHVILAVMPVPIPWSDLEGPCSASWLWPDAASVLQQHEQHAVATVLSDDGAVERATLLTQALASVLATCAEALGVYWGDAGLIISPEIFQAFAGEMHSIGPPLYLWVDFRVGRSDAGPSVGYTVGLSALGHMEFEARNSPEPPGELRERLFNFANYVVENGPVIQDGDTIGRDADERIRVVYTASQFGHQGRVMRLEYQP